MNLAEAGQLLAVCSAFDRRHADEIEVAAWAKVLGDMDYADCEAAVIAHYQTTREWIMPADIRALAKAGRRRAREIEQREVILDPAAHKAQIARQDRALLAKLRQRVPHLAITGGTGERHSVPRQVVTSKAGTGPAHPSRAEQLAALEAMARKEAAGDSDPHSDA